jgi:cytochrome b6-f complex iron-sulfur subunit
MSATSSPGGSRLDPEPVPRRDFLGIASVTAAGGALAFAAVGMMRLPKAAVLSSPSKKFQVTLPDSLAPGQPFFPPGRQVVLFRDASGVWAISTICTHLGCLVRGTPEGFECPCHGSYFTPDGAVTKGPAPQALPWFKVTGSGNTYVVDEGETVPSGTKV